MIKICKTQFKENIVKKNHTNPLMFQSQIHLYYKNQLIYNKDDCYHLSLILEALNKI